MSKLGWFAKFWLPALLWAFVIFSASGDQKSVHRSSRIIEPVVRWLIPDVSDETVQRTVLIVRKWAHITEYAVFAALLLHGFRASMKAVPGEWSSRCARFAWLGATAFAITDEWHQLYVPGRQGSPWDVLIDSCGAVLGLFAVRTVMARWRQWKQRS